MLWILLRVNLVTLVILGHGAQAQGVWDPRAQPMILGHGAQVQGVRGPSQSTWESSRKCPKVPQAAHVTPCSTIALGSGARSLLEIGGRRKEEKELRGNGWM